MNIRDHPFLYQWDTNRYLDIPEADAVYVDFARTGEEPLRIAVADGGVRIPDSWLQTAGNQNIYVCYVDGTLRGYTLRIAPRPKPPDYVFTPPDQISLQEIKERVEYLESIQDPDAIKNAVNDYLEQNPVEAPVQSVNGKTGAVKLNAIDVGAISQDDLANVQSTIAAKMDSYTIKTVMDSVATPHTQYYLGNQADVDIVLPDSADVGQIITVCWYNGEPAATLSITGTMLDFDFAPSANTRSEVNALWDGRYWAVIGNEIAFPEVAE